MRILLALLIGIYAFGTDVCEQKEAEIFLYVEKYADIYKNKNLNLSEEEKYKKAVADCNARDEKACLYIYNNFIIDGNFKFEENIFNLIEILNNVGIIIEIAQPSSNKELNSLISFNSFKNSLEVIDYVLSKTNDKKIIEELKALKKRNTISIFLNGNGCPAYSNGKLESDTIKMPCLCKKNSAYLLLEPDNIRQAFLNLKLLCDKYKDSVSCGAVGGFYENGQGVRVDFKQAKKYYGLACDGGYQYGCDGYKRMMGY
ncbi:sel1 repeat family protein [Campylobacter sp. CCS1377]|uniref:beta-lactamase n=1 Tax=Campylobacter sp. CCS1377 TaxID=3158229 RepID=A0AAU7E6F4_9BACT